MPASVVQFKFPVLGVDERRDYYDQPEGTTVDALNVYSDGMLTERERGGSRPGIGKVFAAQLGSGNPIRLLNTVRFIDSSGAPQSIAVASAGGLLYRENSGNWEQVTSDLTLASDRQLDSEDFFGRLYIADHGPVVASGEDGVIGGDGDNEVTSTTAGNWASAGADKDDHFFVIEEHDPINAEFNIALSGSPTDGVVRWRDSNTGLDAEWDHDATADAVEDALEELYGAGNVAVTGEAGDWDVEFTGDLAGQEIPTPEIDSDYLEGGTDPAAAVTVTSEGATAFRYAGTYAISSIATTTLTTVKAIRDLTGVHFYVSRSPKVYDPVANTLSAWLQDDDEFGNPKGAIPVGRSIISQFNQRLYLAGGVHSPNTFSCSRQGDAHDWDGSQEDAGRPIHGTSDTRARVGEPITGLVPHEHKCMVIFCRNSMWVQRGDITAGSIENLSFDVGLISNFACATTTEGLLLWLSLDGLYGMASPCGGKPESLSRETLPRSLMNIDLTAYTPCLAYDTRYRMLHVWVTKNTTSDPTTHYLVDTKLSVHGDKLSAAFYPSKLGDEAYEPFFVHERRDAASEYSLVYLGCRDGYVRRFQHDLAQDDGTDFSSHVMVGRIPLSDDPMRQGRINELQAIIPSGSGDVDATVYSGNSPEEALNDTRAETVEFNATGHSRSHYIRKRGTVAFVKLANGETNKRWEFSQGTLTVLPGGRVRP